MDLRGRKSLVFVVLIALAVAGRLLAHQPNLTPMAAAVLFAGFFFRTWYAAAAVGLVSMAISDALIGTYEVPVMISVYVSLLAPLALRALLKAKLTPGRIAVGAVSSSLAFFLVTNFAVWAFGGWYPHSADGLLACYTAALVFLKYTLAGDLFWSAVLFGGYALAARLSANASRRLVAA